MHDVVKFFSAEEDGAVTVDWVVLTGAIVGLGIAVVASIRTGAVEMASDIGTTLSAAEVPSIDFDN